MSEPSAEDIERVARAIKDGGDRIYGGQIRELRGRVRELEAELARGRGWQPIEDAPKDGTPILGFMPSYYQGKGGISVILWMPTGGKLKPGPDDGEWRDNRAWATTPTHWMPLPAPPQEPKP